MSGDKEPIDPKSDVDPRVLEVVQRELEISAFERVLTFVDTCLEAQKRGARICIHEGDTVTEIEI